MVDADAAKAEKSVNPVQCVADDRRPQMTDVERLGDVRRRIVDDDGAAFADRPGAVTFALGQDGAQHVGRKTRGVPTKIKVSADGFHGSGDRQVVFPPPLGKRRCDRLGRLAQRFAQFETRQREIAEIGVRRVFEQFRNCGGVYPFELRGDPRGRRGFVAIQHGTTGSFPESPL